MPPQQLSVPSCRAPRRLVLPSLLPPTPPQRPKLERDAWRHCRRPVRLEARFGRLRGYRLCRPRLRSVLRVTTVRHSRPLRRSGLRSRLLPMRLQRLSVDRAPPCRVRLRPVLPLSLLLTSPRSVGSRSVMLGAIADAVARLEAASVDSAAGSLCRSWVRSVLRVTMVRTVDRCDARVYDFGCGRRVCRG